MQDLAPHLILLLFVAAFFAGFVDSIAGGGGLITVPAMLIVGLPPLQMLGTNKAQSIFGAASATIAYARKGHVHLPSQLLLGLMAVGGGALGATLATILPGDLLRGMLPFLLIAIAVYFALKPNLGDIERHHRISKTVFGLTLVPLIAFYDGAFGPGTGSFFMLAFVTLAGYGLLKATAHTKLLNFGSNLGSLIVFASYGVILWKIGLMMGVGQFLGAQAGSRFAMRNGSKIIKPLLVCVCIAFAVKLISDPTNPVRMWLGI
ncbi:TSUP family transporter [Rhizobium sp. RAF56]|uniref:TSUP family transporter n=1 Tax=Rhizobium sp. RAF56 TaxID=3233062 RepID=UPI003F9D1E6B